jgi:hypothetical protein
MAMIFINQNIHAIKPSQALESIQANIDHPSYLKNDCNVYGIDHY